MDPFARKMVYGSFIYGGAMLVIWLYDMIFRRRAAA